LPDVSSDLAGQLRAKNAEVHTLLLKRETELAAALGKLERIIEAWDRVDFANLREVLEGSRETLLLSQRLPPREDKA